MNKLQALNTWMTPKMPLLILGALALGLLFPDQIGLLCPAVSALMPPLQPLRQKAQGPVRKGARSMFADRRGRPRF